SAGLDELPGRLIPIASTADARVFAVYIPPQEPAPGHALHSMDPNSSSSISPLLCLPTPSKIDTTSISFPCSEPGAIVPPYTKTDGTSALAMATIQPRILSCPPPIATNESKF